MHSKETNSCMNQGKVAGALTVKSVLLCICFISPSAIKATLGTPRSRWLPSMETSGCSSGLGLKLIICNPVFKDKFLSDLFSTIWSAYLVESSIYCKKAWCNTTDQNKKVECQRFLTCILIYYLIWGNNISRDMMLQHTIPATGSNDSCLQHKMPVKFHWAKKISSNWLPAKKLQSKLMRTCTGLNPGLSWDLRTYLKMIHISIIFHDFVWTYHKQQSLQNKQQQLE